MKAYQCSCFNALSPTWLTYPNIYPADVCRKSKAPWRNSKGNVAFNTRHVHEVNLFGERAALLIDPKSINIWTDEERRLVKVQAVCTLSSLLYPYLPHSPYHTLKQIYQYPAALSKPRSRFSRLKNELQRSQLRRDLISHFPQHLAPIITRSESYVEAFDQRRHHQSQLGGGESLPDAACTSCDDKWALVDTFSNL